MLTRVIAEAHDKGGEADTLIVCAAIDCGGVLAGSVGSMWCTRCGARWEQSEIVEASAEFERAWDDCLRVRSLSQLILDSDHGGLRNDPEFVRMLKGVALAAWLEARARRPA